MVREYRERFPSKAVITGLDQRDGWAFVAAGGSFPALPETTDPALRTALARMQPFAMASAKPHAKASRSWTLADSDHQYFIYAANGGDLPLDLTTATGHFAVRQIDPSTGRIREAANAPLKAGGVAVISAPLGAPALFWIVR